MIRNKKTINVIMRLLTAVFLFVLISNPLSALAAGESASENESEDSGEYTDWSDAFNDSDYTDNLAENVASTFASYFQSYVGTREDVINDVANYIGDSYDRTVSLYENVYQYVLPYARTEVTQFDGANLSQSVYGKPVRKKNNLKLINTLQNELKQSLPTTFVDIAESKKKELDRITFDGIPSNISFADHPKIEGAIIEPNYGHCVYYYGYYGQRGNVLLNNNCDNAFMYLYVPYAENHNEGIGMSLIFPTGETGTTPYITRAQWNSGGYTDIRYSNSVNGYDFLYAGGWPYDGHIFISGSCYLNIRTNNGNTNNYYYYDSDTRSLYKLAYAPTSGGIDQNEIINTDVFEFNIINSVDFDEYNDLINQLILDVNMENNITNSLLIEILNELRNQRDVYQPTSDDDDIYDYIDYMMNKFLEVKDIHIEIPDLSPNMGGIVDGITALLNFLASIIRAIGGIVSSLIQGLLDLLKLLFIPDETASNTINIQINNIFKPVLWIGDFMDNSKTMISILLFGDDDSLSDDGSGNGSGNGSSGSGSQEPPVITVDFGNSTSEYDYGGEVAILDLSWYSPYKSTCDSIIVAFCWILFIVRVVKDIPGIINGFSSNSESEGE